MFKMKYFILLMALFIQGNISLLWGQTSLPKVFEGEPADLIGLSLELEAAKAFSTLQIPGSKKSWISYREELKSTIIEKTGVDFFPDLPLDYHETRSHVLPGLTVKNIYFQTRPGVYATANLYIPEGEGPFPGVVTMMGHSSNGKMYDVYQAIGHSLALNGYVSLHIDPWGAGERTTAHGEFEYHGANLGSSLMNIGESLMGMQITDNIRAVDLLCSLPFIDPKKIGATGASGGGNQTMWLAAMDERIKVAVPVVSVGTFQSYVLNSNCICETLIDGLTFTEEAAVLGLIAPRALKLCNGAKDSNKAFLPAEMLKSFERAKPIYGYYDVEEKFSHQVFDTPHGYFPEIREAMLGWFDLHLKNKGDGNPKKEKPFTLLTESDLMVFPKGERNLGVISTPQFCTSQGASLRKTMLSNKNINSKDKKEELKKLLKIPAAAANTIKEIHLYTGTTDWERVVIETTCGDLIPVLLHVANRESVECVIFSNPEGKNNIPENLINKALTERKSVCIVDLWGTGENSSANAKRIDGSLPDFHTLARSALWLGKTTQGIWVSQLNIVAEWLIESHKMKRITIDAAKEASVAALFLSVLETKASKLILRDAPLSYLFDESGDANNFSMAIHLPGILKWGDISLAAGISESEITFVGPVSISGRKLTVKEVEKYKKEFSSMNNLFGNQAQIIFAEKNN